MAVSIKVYIPNIPKLSKRIFSDDVRKYANTRLHAYCSPYVPMNTGYLDQTVEITPECVHYKAPYANRVHKGDGMNFSKDKHPLATAHWERSMAVAKGQQLANDITGYIERK